MDEPTVALGVSQTAQVSDPTGWPGALHIAVLVISQIQIDVVAVADRRAVPNLGSAGQQRSHRPSTTRSAPCQPVTHGEAANIR